MSKLGRFQWIDSVKGVGIFLVLLGHLPGVNFVLETLIYSFHMPLFFIVSGFLFNKKEVLTGVGYFSKQLKSLLVPYVFFAFLSCLYFSTLKYSGVDAPVYTNNSYFSAFWGVLVGEGSYLFVNVALWFLVALFFVRCWFYFILRFISGQRKIFFVTLAITTIVIFILRRFEVNLLLSLDSAILGLLFFSFGYFIREEFDLEFYHFGGFVTIGLLCGFSTIAWMNGRVDMNSFIIGNPFLYFLSGITGSLLIYIYRYAI